jgi:hypothetical protein
MQNFRAALMAPGGEMPGAGKVRWPRWPPLTIPPSVHRRFSTGSTRFDRRRSLPRSGRRQGSKTRASGHCTDQASAVGLLRSPSPWKSWPRIPPSGILTYPELPVVSGLWFPPLFWTLNCNLNHTSEFCVVEMSPNWDMKFNRISTHFRIQML